ncbi:MAG: hypothetical protein V7746_19390 [Halioglobus sp.]
MLINIHNMLTFKQVEIGHNKNTPERTRTATNVPFSCFIGQTEAIFVERPSIVYGLYFRLVAPEAAFAAAKLFSCSPGVVSGISIRFITAVGFALTESGPGQDALAQCRHPDPTATTPVM